MLTPLFVAVRTADMPRRCCGRDPARCAVALRGRHSPTFLPPSPPPGDAGGYAWRPICHLGDRHRCCPRASDGIAGGTGGSHRGAGTVCLGICHPLFSPGGTGADCTLSSERVFLQRRGVGGGGCWVKGGVAWCLWLLHGLWCLSVEIVCLPVMGVS